MKKLFALFLVILLIPSVLAATYSYIGPVSDYADIITPEWESQITSLTQEIESSTTAEIRVLTIQSLEGQDPSQFAVEIFEEWGIGKKGINNGLLVLVSLEDRNGRIEVGYGLEPYITDAMAGRIARANFPENFRAGDYGKGIYSALVEINGVIQNKPDIVAKYDTASPSPIGYIALFILIIGAIVVTLITNKKASKAKWTARIGFGIGGALILFLLFSLYLSSIFLFFYIFFVLPRTAGIGRHGPGGGMMFFGGLGGGGSGGGLGGLGGGMSGGGGANFRW